MSHRGGEVFFFDQPGKAEYIFRTDFGRGVFIENAPVGQGGIVSHLVDDLGLAAAVPGEHVGKLVPGEKIRVLRRADGGEIHCVVHVAGHKVSVGGGGGAVGVKLFCNGVELAVEGIAPLHLVSAAPRGNAGVVAVGEDELTPLVKEEMFVFAVQSLPGDVCQLKLRLKHKPKPVRRGKKGLEGKVAVVTGVVKAVFLCP